ncbi:MAG TPA: SPFH domain-containing protein [Pseudobdellovibrionaceae bacterium]|jgi:regulator of protease activity HflC (stomatin/prohibitin superfamily)
MLDVSLALGFISSAVIIFGGYYILKSITTIVEDESETFVLNCGQVTKRLQKPGLHWVPEKIFPWIKTFSVSKQVDFRTYKGIQVNDHFGTTVIVDLWVEFKIVDPYKAIFCVENWEEVLQSLVTHTLASVLCSQTVEEILIHRTELAQSMHKVMGHQTERWGVSIQGAMIQNLGLLPETSKQFFNSVAARIEKTKALIEEEGRLQVARLDAETTYRIAELSAVAKAQMAYEIGSAYRDLARRPQLLRAFQDYWEVVQTDPRKTITFSGFENSRVAPLEASMAADSVLNH